MTEFYPLFADRCGRATDEEFRLLAFAIPRMLRNIEEIRSCPELYYAEFPLFFYGCIFGEGFGITVGQLLDQWEEGAFRDGEWFFFGGNGGFSGSFIHGVNVKTGEHKELTTGMSGMETSEGRPWNYFRFRHAAPCSRPAAPLSFSEFYDWFNLFHPPDGDTSLPPVKPRFLKRMEERGWQPSIPEMEFAAIPEGEFLMGRFETSDTTTDKEEFTCLRFPMGFRHRRRQNRWFPGIPVNVQGFEIMANPVTRGMWQKVTGELRCGKGKPKLPVTRVSWHDCVAFAEVLSSLDPVYNYSLPTEAQWEYACRAGTTTDYVWGNDFFKRNGYNVNTELEPRLKSAYAGRKNSRGVRGMWGGTSEWCLNRFAPVYPYPCRTPEYVTGGGIRSIRGGLRHGPFPASYSMRRPPWFRDGAQGQQFVLGLGFRLVRIPKESGVPAEGGTS